MTITRHQATGAYKRWTPPAFDEEAEHATEAPAPPPPEPAATPKDKPVAAQAAPVEAPAPPAEPAVKLPTAAEVESMYEQARAEGAKAGFDEGIAKARNEAAQITRLVRSMDTALDGTRYSEW